MCLICVQKNIYSNALDAIAFPWLSIPPGEIERMPAEDTYSFEFPSESGGNAVFDLEWTGGEFYVGKTLSVSYMIEDVDGFNPDDVNVEWYHFGVDAPIHTGKSYTLTGDDLDAYIAVVVKFIDGSGNEEYWGDTAWDSDPNAPTYKFIGQVIAEASETPNAARTTVSYTDFLAHFTDDSVGMAAQEDFIEILAETHQGKWGGVLGTAPESLSYSITPEGVIDYSEAQYAEHPLYTDIEDAGQASALGASLFTAEDITNIEIALNDWTAITGIDFVRDDSLGSKADLAFTKLDFAAWSASSNWIDPNSAGFAFQPTVGSDFLVGDIFLDASLSDGYGWHVSPKCSIS